MRLAFELVDGVKQIFIPSVVVTQSCLTLQPPWTRECQAPLSMEFSRQEYWNGLPYLPPGDLPNPGIQPTFLMSPSLAGGFFTTSATWEDPFPQMDNQI